MRLASLLIVVASLTCFLTPAARSADPPRATTVFDKGWSGYHTFRIPALLVTKRGTLLAFCEGRKTSSADHGDIDLMLRRSTDGGKTWGHFELVYEEGGTAKITIGNPCPVVEQETGTIWLPFTRNNDDVFITYSTDDGQTWAKPRKITADVKQPGWEWYATGPGVGIQLRHGPHKGRLVIPCDHRAKVDGQLVTRSHCIFSDDRGKTWKLGSPVARHTNECQVVELPGGELLINMRNYWGRDGGQPDKDRMRAVARSTDGGATWGDLRFDRTLVEPICQASLIRYSWPDLHGKSRLLFANPASADKRHLLTVRLSYDEGRTWPVAKLLHKGPSAYSCLAVLPDGSIACLYECGRQSAYETISFVRFDLAWLTDGKDKGRE
jgi:sialidase-1